MLSLISKISAKALGLKFYFTGIPCIRNHIDQRRVGNNVCLSCEKERGNNYYQKNHERCLAVRAKYRNLNPEKSRNWQLENLNHCRNLGFNWRKGNRKLLNAIEAKRHADKLLRTPKWADLKAIKKFYQNCPDGLTVDHVIPLRGKRVSGLHVSNNLQYLTQSENSRKRHFFDPDNWEEPIHA